MNKNGQIESYDLLVKYNEIDTPESISFEEFWSAEGVVNNNTVIGNNTLTLDNPTFFSIKAPYAGYLKIKGKFESEGLLQIDGVDVLDPTGDFIFEGQVKEHIFIQSLGLASCNFTEFSTSSYNVSVSEISQDFYGNISTNNPEAYGEIIFDNLGNVEEHNSFEWYNEDNDIVANKMEFWSLGAIDNTGDIQTTSAITKSSGYQELTLSNISKFPILIHIKDIGKKNKIGPFLQEDDSEIYINLTII